MGMMAPTQPPSPLAEGPLHVKAVLRVVYQAPGGLTRHSGNRPPSLAYSSLAREPQRSPRSRALPASGVCEPAPSHLPTLLRAPGRRETFLCLFCKIHPMPSHSCHQEESAVNHSLSDPVRCLSDGCLDTWSHALRWGNPPPGTLASRVSAVGPGQGPPSAPRARGRGTHSLQASGPLDTWC